MTQRLENGDIGKSEFGKLFTCSRYEHISKMCIDDKTANLRSAVRSILEWKLEARTDSSKERKLLRIICRNRIAATNEITAATAVVTRTLFHYAQCHVHMGLRNLTTFRC